MKRFAFFRGLLVCALAVSAGTGCTEAPSSDPALRAEAPGFSLVQLDGTPVRLADHLGKTVILDFWATWCAPCEVQMPVLDTLWKRRGGAELMVLGISVDTDPSEKVSAWVEKRSLEYPIAIAEQSLAVDYGVIGFPTLIVIDRVGRIHTRHTGVLSRPELEEILDEIAAETPATG